MSISIISNAAANVSITASAASLPQPETLSECFAALLSGQTLGVTPSLLTDSTHSLSTRLKNSETPSDNEARPGDAPLDQSILAAMLGFLQPTVVSPQPQNSADVGTRNQENKPLLETTSDLTARNALDDINADPKSTNKDNASLTIPVQDKGNLLASQANDAANIAADSRKDSGGATGFELAMNNVTTSREKADIKQVAISAPLTSAIWPEKLGEQIVWLAKSNQQSAQININPPQLGPVQITLSLNGDQASAIFTSPHSEVRQTIEASLPQLREMLASVGISLGDANVGANLPQQNQPQAFLSGNRNQSMDENAILPANEKATTIGSAQFLQRGSGLVDLFA